MGPIRGANPISKKCLVTEMRAMTSQRQNYNIIFRLLLSQKQKQNNANIMLIRFRIL